MKFLAKSAMRASTALLIATGAFWVALPADAGWLTVHETTLSTVAENRNLRHPTGGRSLMRVSEDLLDRNASISIRYWRTSTKKPSKGRIKVQITVLRQVDPDSDPVVVFAAREGGRLSSRFFGRGVGPLPPLLAGDAIIVSYQFLRMPSIRRHEAYFAEAALRVD